MVFPFSGGIIFAAFRLAESVLVIDSLGSSTTLYDLYVYDPISVPL